jgi:hypothetical protein
MFTLSVYFNCIYHLAISILIRTVSIWVLMFDKLTSLTLLIFLLSYFVKFPNLCITVYCTILESFDLSDIFPSVNVNLI